MNAYEKIRAALNQADALIPDFSYLKTRNDEALSALAELERAAAEPVATLVGFDVETGLPADIAWHADCATFNSGDNLYAAPPAKPAPQFVAGEVTRPMCHGAWARFWSEPNNGDSCDQAMRWLEAWRSELGPALGLVELREPTPEECERIEEEYARNERRVYTRRGRDMADAVIAVMWPKEGL